MWSKLASETIRFQDHRGSVEIWISNNECIIVILEVFEKRKGFGSDLVLLAFKKAAQLRYPEPKAIVANLPEAQAFWKNFYNKSKCKNYITYSFDLTKEE